MASHSRDLPASALGSSAQSEKGELQIYRRPGCGTEGQFVDLLANWYELKCTLKGREIYQYHIVVEEVINKDRKIVKNRSSIRRYFWNCVIKNWKVFGPHFQIVFDDAQVAFSLERWKFDGENEKEFKIRDGRRVAFVTATEDTLFPFDLMSHVVAHRTLSTLLANILFTQRARYARADADRNERDLLNRWELCRNTIYCIPQPGGDPDFCGPFIDAGVRAWLGAYTSVKTLQSSNYALAFGLVNCLFYELNMDLITFYYYVLEQVRMYRGSPQTFEKDLKNMAMNQSQRNHFVKRLKGVRVRTDNAIVYDRNGKVAMSRRHGVFEDVLNWPPSRHKMRDGKFMDEVYYYYHERPLRFPHLPLGQIRVGKNTVEVPLEFIYLHEKPQRYLKLMDHNMKAAFIKAVCRKPPDHKRLTDKLLNMMDFNRMPGFINSFLFHVNPEMIRCKGLILDAPIAIDKDRNPVDMTPLRAIKRKELNEPPNGEIVIAVIIMGVEISRREWQPCVSEVDAKKFFDDLVKKCRERGMSVAADVLRFYNNVEPIRDEFERYVMDALERLNPEKKLLILVINEEQRTPNSGIFNKGSSYGVIKSVCDNKYGVATQVVDASTVKKAVSDDKKTVYYNIALKINAKLGGVNQAVVFDKESNSAEVSPKEAVMYVGIDVTHPTNTSRIDISIASIVANVDLAATRYTNEIMAQMAARETVERFETQFGRLMARFHEHSKVWPRHIVIFRDGISDSEMLRTAFVELQCIRDSWNHLTFEDPQLEPTFTYIVIQKRHLTRFYQPGKDEQGQETYVNVSSGTVVDNVVVSPQFFDFYLASQIGTLGTTRPAHYTVLYDEWMLSPDRLYEMCYRLCFLYARCRIPVSLPCPVYYAHRVCEKAKDVYKTLLDAKMFDKFTDNQEKKQKIEEYLTVRENYPGMHFV